MVERLDTAVGDMARALDGRLTGASGHLRNAAGRLEHADSAGRPPIGRMDTGAARSFIGTDSSGKFVRFSSDDVVSVPLKDSRGDVIGVSFPSRRGDIGSKKRWAAAELRSSDHVHYAFWKKDPDATRPSWVFGRRRTAPWADENPVYAHAHADSRTFHIKVKTGRWSSRPVQVTGDTYAELLARNEHLAQALAAKPGPLVLLSCSPARESGSAAAAMTQYLHAETGIARDVYAAKGDVMTQRWGNVSSVGVEVDTAIGDAAEPLWEVYRTPPGRSAAPEANEPATSAEDDTDPFGFPPIRG